jgi:ribosomal protein S18 acetylase RimI-like enzyme
MNRKADIEMIHGPVSWRTQALSADVEAVRRICLSTGFFSDEEVAVAVELVEERLAKGPASGYEFLFAEAGGEVAGYACFGHIAGTRSSWDLYWIVVENGFRGHGLGAQLMARAEQAVARAGGTKLYIETSSRTQYRPTRAFYFRVGCVKQAVIEDFYARGDHKVILVRSLGAETGREAPGC